MDGGGAQLRLSVDPSGAGDVGLPVLAGERRALHRCAVLGVLVLHRVVLREAVCAFARIRQTVAVGRWRGRGACVERDGS